MSAPLAVAPARGEANAFVRAVHAISTLCGWVAAGLTVVALFVTCHMIFVRAVLGQSTIWQTEAVIYMMIAATCIGLPYVQKLRGHVNVDLLPMALSPGPRKVLAYVILLATMAVIAMVAWYSWDVFHQAWRRNWKSPSVWGPPLWVPYLVLPLGFGLFLLQLLADLVGLITGAQKPFGIAEES